MPYIDQTLREFDEFFNKVACVSKDKVENIDRLMKKN